MRGWQIETGGLGVYYDGTFWVDKYQEYNSASGGFDSIYLIYKKISIYKQKDLHITHLNICFQLVRSNSISDINTKPPDGINLLIDRVLYGLGFL